MGSIEAWLTVSCSLYLKNLIAQNRAWIFWMETKTERSLRSVSLFHYFTISLSHLRTIVDFFNWWKRSWYRYHATHCVICDRFALRWHCHPTAPRPRLVAHYTHVSMLRDTVTPYYACTRIRIRLSRSFVANTPLNRNSFTHSFSCISSLSDRNRYSDSRLRQHQHQHIYNTIRYDTLTSSTTYVYL